MAQSISERENTRSAAGGVHFEVVENVVVAVAKRPREVSAKSRPNQRSGRRARPETMTVTLHALGLHRRKREVLRGIADQIERLQNLVGLLESIGGDTFADDEPAQLRASSTIMRTALREIVGTTIEMAAHLGELRFAAHLSALELEPPDNVVTSVNAVSASSPTSAASSSAGASGPQVRERRPRRR